ncbi:MAG: Spy/CpxP family protein refolding chaperone [Anaeromyxobacter sp.]
MNPTLKRILTASVTGLVVLGGVVTLAGWRFQHRMHDPAEVAAFVNDRVDDALDDLDATPAQRTQLHAVADRMLAAGRAFHDAGRSGHEVALEAWKSPNPDKAQLHALVDERIDAARAIAHQAVDAAVEVHDTLTPEQREKVTKKLERHMSRWER